MDKVDETIDLVSPDGVRRQAHVTGDVVWHKQTGPECRLVLTAPGIHITASGADFFESFCRVREQLENDFGLRPHCYGASRYVYPSGMCRDMGLGLRAYNKRELGVAVKMQDLVDIFDTGADVEPASVADQRAFAEESWKAFRR